MKLWWSWPLELLQRAGVRVWVGGGRGGQLLRLQAVGEGVQVFHQQTHHQHVLLCRAEGFLKRQSVTKCHTHSQSPISSHFQKAANRNASHSKSSQSITKGSEHFVVYKAQRSHAHWSLSFSNNTAIHRNRRSASYSGKFRLLFCYWCKVTPSRWFHHPCLYVFGLKIQKQWHWTAAVLVLIRSGFIWPFLLSNFLHLYPFFSLLIKLFYPQLSSQRYSTL